MTRTDLREAVAILDRVLDALLSTVPSAAGRTAADLRRAVGDLRSGAEALIATASLGPDLLNCFSLARAAGATLQRMDRVRAAAAAESPSGLAGKAVASGAVRLALAQEARILAEMTFESREDVETLGAQMNLAFGDAEDAAADLNASESYRALVSLHAAVTRHLTERSRPLPRVVSYLFAVAQPALALANRIYSDGSRYAELVAENKIVHPLFCPPAGRALSA